MPRQWFNKEERPMETVQKQINRRPHIAHKFHKGMDTGRIPHDIRPRSKEPIPPFHEDSHMDHHYGDGTKEEHQNIQDQG